MTIRELINNCIFVRCDECKYSKECTEFMQTHRMTPDNYSDFMDVNWDEEIKPKRTLNFNNELIYCKDCIYNSSGWCTRNSHCLNEDCEFKIDNFGFCSWAEKG